MLESIPRNLLAGLFCVIFGSFVIWQGYEYSVGTLSSMGPGFLPLTLGVLLIPIGIGLMLQSIRDGQRFGQVNLWPLVMIPLAIAVFGFTIQRFGFLIAAPLSVLIAGMADRTMNKRHLVVLTVGLVILVYVIFAYILRMPIDLVRWRP